MAVAEEPDGPEDAAYQARTALDGAQEYAELLANYAQMKYMHEGGDAEQRYLSRLVKDEGLPFDEAYDPESIEGWVEEPGKREEILSLYEDRIEEFLGEEADQLQRTLRSSKISKNRADAADELEASQHRHYTAGEVDPGTVDREYELAATLVSETDTYAREVFGDQVREQTSELARSTSFQGFDPSEL